MNVPAAGLAPLGTLSVIVSFTLAQRAWIKAFLRRVEMFVFDAFSPPAFVGALARHVVALLADPTLPGFGPLLLVRLVSFFVSLFGLHQSLLLILFLLFLFKFFLSLLFFFLDRFAFQIPLVLFRTLFLLLQLHKLFFPRLFDFFLCKGLVLLRGSFLDRGRNGGRRRSRGWSWGRGRSN
jgi:hypothetical protein